MNLDIHTDDQTIAEIRQKARNGFTYQLLCSYPDPRTSIREQVDHMFDRWWPGTVPSPSEEAGEPILPDTGKSY